MEDMVTMCHQVFHTRLNNRLLNIYIYICIYHIIENLYIYIPSWKLTYPIKNGTFEDDFPEIPRWDVLISWRVYIYIFFRVL